MPSLVSQIVCRDADLRAGFARIRAEIGVPEDFPPEVSAEALRLAAQEPSGAGEPAADRREVPLVTIDPHGSRDLDQAYAAERRPGGYRVFYAIADVAAFVSPDSAVDNEARQRGVTLYSPDEKAPLHPFPLSEDAASLLAEHDRQALLWTIDLDPSGEINDARVERSRVRSRQMLTYQQAQDVIDSGGDDSLGLLKEIGLLREAREAERGGVSLQRASQEITRVGDGWGVHYDTPLPVEGWNAQMSLLTGIAAAEIMLSGGVGILRTLPTPDEETVAGLRRRAQALELDWPTDVSYPDFARGLSADTPESVAMIAQAARGLRGAGYEAFDGAPPERTLHSAIGASYSHVTAPLRRLVDRFANEVLVALSAGDEPPAWVREALPTIPRLMNQARSRDRALERALVDYTETMILSGSVGQSFAAVVVDIDDERDRATIQLSQPAVVARMPSTGLTLGEQARVRLESADPQARELVFSRA